MGVRSRLTGLLVSLGMLAAFTAPALAGTTGTLRGQVVDAQSGEPISAATIIIEGTKRGGIADPTGVFQIPFVEAGTYSITSRATGHKPLTIPNVTIVADFTTTRNFRLESEAVTTKEILVSGERPLVQRDATSTVRYKTSEEIQRLPTRGYQQVAALQTGVAQLGNYRADTESQNAPSLYIRGGRSNEVAYFVDGFSQQDPLTGISTTSINNNAIDQVVVLTGGFNAEYGRVMSGAVNVITKDGTAKYHGSLEAVTDNLGGDWIGTAKYDQNIYAGSLGGPLLPNKDNVTFYVSGERRWNGDRAPRPIEGEVADELGLLGHNTERLPHNSLSGWSWQGKLNFRPTDKTRFRIGTLGSTDNWNEYIHEYLMNLSHAPRYEDRNWNGFASLTQQTGENTFVELAGNYSYTGRKRGDGLYFDNLLGYARINGNPVFSSDLPYFQPGDDPSTAVTYDTLGQVTDGDESHVFDDYLRRESSYIGSRLDITSQVNRQHQVKLGADFQRHTLRFYNHLFPVQLADDPTTPEDERNFVDVNFFGYDNLATTNVDDGLNGAKHPITASVYAQDKYESGGIVVNGGLRLDYLAPRTEALADESYPIGINGDQPLTVEAGTLIDSKTYTRLSPRLGVGFPVTDRTVFHLNYGKFYQQPNLQDLYVNYDYLAYKVQVGGYFYPFGNPNLKPETTTAYEVGFVHQLTDVSRLDVAVYYKDIKDLVEVANIPSHPSAFSSYRNRDFGTTKGVDFAYTLRPSGHMSADLSYSFSFANGTGSLSTSQRNIAWTSSEPPKQTAALDFDQRHKMSASLDLRNGPGEGPTIGGGHLLQNAGINLLFNAASGSPFTPNHVFDERTLAAISPVPAGPINSRYGPWRHQLDMKVNKDFGLAGRSLSAYIWVINAFDRKNATTVYTSSGSPLSTGWLDTQAGQAFLASQGAEGLTIHDLAEANPNLFDTPRLVRFGLRMEL